MYDNNDKTVKKGKLCYFVHDLQIILWRLTDTFAFTFILFCSFDVQIFRRSWKNAGIFKESILKCVIFLLQIQLKSQQTKASTRARWYGHWASVCSGSAVPSVVSVIAEYAVAVFFSAFALACMRGPGTGTCNGMVLCSRLIVMTGSTLSSTNSRLRPELVVQ